MKIYYIITLTYQLTGHPDNFKIKLYYFHERLSLQYNIILKVVSVLYMDKLNVFTETTKLKYLDKMHYV